MPPGYDLVVIGYGPAGEKGAARAAYFGKRVAIVERSGVLGGAGVNTGTVPSKTLRETALYFSGLRQRGLYGIDYSLREGLTVRDFMFPCGGRTGNLRVLCAGARGKMGSCCCGKGTRYRAPRGGGTCG